MRKTAMMIALVALLTLVAASVAYAAMIQGNDRSNTLGETRGNDTMYGYAGDDELDANTYSGDADRAYGNADDDLILVNDNDRLDAAVGGFGFDTCVVDARGEVGTSCERVRIR